MSVSLLKLTYPSYELSCLSCLEALIRGDEVGFIALVAHTPIGLFYL